ncbi:fluoride efflux transporter CrcB [Yoonia sp. I 8.24]|uniref:fluoride efflux transporter CrcB n=1 Tax=Yoonia sp. I 8.24 TaxID=1537229 RepID=UPI001EDE6D24|nr:fluoride efflux transporter CrcB [Yoonia sp. I 8.24]MCG3268173.1 fluoride efflux transporter CrcB [Yoonia sp. I 8.24]
MTLLMVACGGALGAVLRYLVVVSVAFPFGTMTVNALGSLLIGVIYATTHHKGLHGWQPFLIVGVLGGFTTFSAFSLDTMRLVEAGRLAAAGGYVMGTVLLSLAACAAGLWIAKGAL